MLDDDFDDDLDNFPMAQEAADWDEDDLGLVWDGAEVERLASQLGAQRAMAAY